MKKGNFTILDNQRIADRTFRMTLAGDTSAITLPGQFVNILLEGEFLRRPISVCDWSPGILNIVYKVVGEGTEKMSKLSLGTDLDLLTGLGNGYDLNTAGELPLLIGGGAGVPPLYGLAKRLLHAGVRSTVILGFNTASEIFMDKEFRALSLPVTVVTADGSQGVRGVVTDVMPTGGYSYLYTCGPEAMLKAVYQRSVTSGQFSFEARMGCGFGACMGCTCETKFGHKRICREGPVLEKEEIAW